MKKSECSSSLEKLRNLLYVPTMYKINPITNTVEAILACRLIYAIELSTIFRCLGISR